MSLTEIGVVGGGQLGRMLLLEGLKSGRTFSVLDPSPDAPAAALAQCFVEGRFTDETAIRRLAASAERLTFEFEHIDAKTLMKLDVPVGKVMPSPETLYMIQDKFRQKSFLRSRGIPVPDFLQVDSLVEAEEAGEILGFPFMLKSRAGGYDGKGNALVNRREDVGKAMTSLGGENAGLMAEKHMEFLMEISVVTARDKAGNLAVFPVGQNIHRNSILHRTLVPAPLPDRVIHEAKELAMETMTQLKGAGIFCIEMFVDKRFQLTINEMAPRTHNSGHHTIESCTISQFGQQVRTLMGWPLAQPELHSPAVMVNLLGDPRQSGKPVLKGITKAMALGKVMPHLYGKAESRPGRKMGHVTILGKTLDEAVKTADRVEECLYVEVIPSIR